METHFIYAGRIHWLVRDKLRSLILKKMKDFTYVMVTSIFMYRRELVTKEIKENYCQGKEWQKESVNDDLESFFDNIRFGKEPNNASIHIYFLPKASEKELELVATNDNRFMASLVIGINPEVDEAEMDSKYIHVECTRKTYTIENAENPIH